MSPTVKEAGQTIAPLDERKARRDKMLELQKGGMSLAAIGERYGMSRERVRQIVARDPLEVGVPRSMQLDRRRSRLLVKRDMWVKHDSPAGRARVREIDEQLAALADEMGQRELL